MSSSLACDSWYHGSPELPPEVMARIEAEAERARAEHERRWAEQERLAAAEAQEPAGE